MIGTAVPVIQIVGMFPHIESQNRFQSVSNRIATVSFFGNFSSQCFRFILHTLYEKSTIEIGDDGSVGHNVTIHGAKICNGALIGMGSVVLDHAVIGEGAIVAAGSVVLSKTIVEPGSIYAGVPAKFVKKVDPEQAKEINQKIAKNYHMYSSWYKEEH